MAPGTIKLDSKIKTYTDVDINSLTRVINNLQRFSMPTGSESNKLSNLLAQYIKSRGSSYFPKNANHKSSRCLTTLWHFFHSPKVTLTKLKFAVYALVQLHREKNPIAESKVVDQIFTYFNKGQSFFDPLKEYGSLEMIAFNHRRLEQENLLKTDDTSVEMKPLPMKS